MINKRMTTLLNGLSRGAFRGLPKGVGLKTAIEARDRQGIEVEGDLQAEKLRCCLTTEGEIYARGLGLHAPTAAGTDRSSRGEQFRASSE